MTEPKHGEERNLTLVTESLDTVFPSSYQFTRSEKWCAFCKKWEQVDGVIGALTWRLDHRHGEEGYSFDKLSRVYQNDWDR